ncbi:MAG: hypothetical protein UV38_C0001G0237 [candidate division TM6 bacterium GW2011_GWE2_42_60]|nr:MAG: hypothetical protein UV38_C0001G0237 [candidate division TM6 bacterium GW2011_GWE2_42_60]HBY05569.1 50S ribosomal protein L29 [Candidatus Dependentiae bacterium]
MIKNEELKKMTQEQLAVKAEELRRDLFQLRLRIATSPVKSFSSDQKKMKRTIARVLTHMNRN